MALRAVLHKRINTAIGNSRTGNYKSSVESEKSVNSSTMYKETFIEHYNKVRRKMPEDMRQKVTDMIRTSKTLKNQKTLETQGSDKADDTPKQNRRCLSIEVDEDRSGD